MRLLLVLLLAACGFACEKQIREAHAPAAEPGASAPVTPAAPPSRSPPPSA